MTRVLDIGKWYPLLKKILENFGFHRYIQEQSLFKYKHDDVKMILNTSTDDFYVHTLISTSSKISAKISSNNLVSQQKQDHFSNISIYESPSPDCSISIDQSEHIEDTIIKKFLPPEKIQDSHL